MAAATVKVGMLVFNTCHADARVLRESETLQSQATRSASSPSATGITRSD